MCNNSLITGTLITSVSNTQTTNIVQNHLNIFIHITINKNPIIAVEIYPSRIALQLLSYAVFILSLSDFQLAFSSFILSKIRTLASTAIQIDNIIAAIPLKDKA
jgi:hypothetical protein